MLKEKYIIFPTAIQASPLSKKGSYKKKDE